ncbi:MAG: hypothetical protein APR63_09625, partial [Desulfuromonas sp. SDB]
MDNFLFLKDEEKEIYFNVIANELNVTPQLIEKDFWVCWTLKTLFSLPLSGNHFTFKGGISLSKCYNIIKRFSEDIDISIERSFLTTQDSIEPNSQQSGKENQRRLKRLKQVCQKKISNVIIPEFENSISTFLPETGKWDIKLDPDDSDKQTVLFIYPSVIYKDISWYIQSVVKIEFGARSDHWPVENKIVTPYVANVSVDIIIESASVRVLAAERTFWEKATILHMIHYYLEDKNLPLRMSRHYYDLFAMADSPIYKKSLDRIYLLKDVSEHKSLFFKANWAHYEEAKSGSLKLLPRENQINQLKNDYRQMEEMF